MGSFNLAAYLKARPDVALYISDAREQGLDTGKKYTQKYGINTTNWEKDWVGRLNAQTGRSAADASEYSSDELTRLHADTWGKNEGTLESKDYKDALASLSGFERKTGDIRGASDLSSETRQDLLNEAGSKEYGGGMSRPELQDFETLIDRLEGSKMRQADQGNRARQRDTMAKGLASMMTNF
jgi:hypothetical protein